MSDSLGIKPDGYRMPDDLRLGPVRLLVSDLERSSDFYRSVIGLMPRQIAATRLAMAGPDGTSIVELVERRGARPVPSQGQLGLFHAAILLPERKYLGQFIRHAFESGIRLGMSDHLVSEAVYLSDPDGHGLEVYADRPRAQWRVEGRQIEMATEPLNAAALVEGAGEERWAGAPAGTCIGHVHLRAGQLDEAARFYHEALGFDKIAWDYPGALFLSAGGYHHHVGLNTWSRSARASAADEARLLEWSIELPSDAALERLEASVIEAGFVAERASNSLVLQDPWGTAVRISAHNIN
jgi:catechol 2,3-dioxygenase